LTSTSSISIRPSRSSHSSVTSKGTQFYTTIFQLLFLSIVIIDGMPEINHWCPGCKYIGDIVGIC
jgi:hypothetical protein